LNISSHLDINISKNKLLQIDSMASLKFGRILFPFLTIFLVTCQDDEVATRSYPSINTTQVTEINATGANLNAEILNTGTSGISDHGFVYDDVSGPDLNKSDRISLGEPQQKGPFSALANRNLVKDKRYYVRAYAITKNNNRIVYGQQVEFISLGGSAPEIEDFLPKHGSIGDTVILIGSGFSNIFTNNKVFFGSFDSYIVKSTIDSLWCVVPRNTKVGENQISLQLGQFNVNPNQKFTLKPISLTSFNPTTVSFGDTLTLTGQNFPTLKDFISVTLLEKGATIITVSPTELKVITPNNVITPLSIITLEAGSQNILSSDELKLSKPLINNFTPLKGTKNTEVTINGDYFSPVKENNTVEISGFQLSVIEATRTKLKAKIPSGITPDHYPISITVATQQIYSESHIEIITPIISNVSPLNGTWRTTVTITGENFGSSVSDNIVKFDNVPAQIISASPSEIKALVPDNLLHKNSTITVQAISVDNQSISFATPFELDPPSISSFIPEEGKSNTVVTLYGENFNPIPANQIVRFGGRQVEILNAVSNQLLVRLPTSLIDSDVQIVIEVAGQTATAPQTFHLISPWRRIMDYSGPAKGSATAFTIANFGYVTLGTQTIQSTDKPCWKYDPELDTWTQVQSYFLAYEGNSGEFINQISFVINDNAYVGLGKTGLTGPRDNMMRYSSSENYWFSISDFAGGGRESSVGFNLNGKGYVTSGRNQNDKADRQIWEYDPALNAWSRKTDFPGTPRIEAAVFTIENKAYLTTGSGYNNGGIFNDLWIYDPNADTWAQRASIPGPTRWKATAFSINGKGYVIGGQNGNTLLKDFMMYDPNINAWFSLEDFPGEARAEAVSFVIGYKAYFGTGFGGPEGYLNDFWEFDPSKL